MPDTYEIRKRFEFGQEHMENGLANLKDDDVEFLISEVEMLELKNVYLKNEITQLKEELKKNK